MNLLTNGRHVEILINENEISETVSKMAEKIEKDYQNKDLVVVCIMNGAFVFASDLTRKINKNFPIYFLKASSYGDQTESSGDVKVKFEQGALLKGKDVLVVEDIVDTGNTVVKINNVLKEYSPSSVSWASFLSKPSRREVEVDIKYIGQEIPDKFVIGYGLDFNEVYRNLPYIGVYQSEESK